MKALIAAAIRAECDKLVGRHHEYLFELDQEAKRIHKRTGVAPMKDVRLPPHWAVGENFNPFKVRVDRKVKTLSHSIAKKLRGSEYVPQTAILRKVPKPDGTLREVCIFQIPDAAISRLVYKSLLYKNSHRFSSYSYAYREDVGAHEAVSNIYQDWIGRERIYVAEFDFSKFFDNIDHEFLRKAMKRGGFLMTPQERHVIEQFLSCKALDDAVYVPTGGVPRTKGIPQGTSVSLFLANAACWELDRSLERLGVGFARYADDTLVWSESYERVVEAYETLRRFSTLVGAPINYKKSEGIHILSRDPKAEISSKQRVVFLGYEIGLDGISIAPRHISKIKKNLAKIIYCNLLKLPKGGAFNIARFGGVDMDYVVAISQIRRYLYGGLTDSKLLSYVRGATTRLNFRGLMSFYPVVNDEAQLRQLDGWLKYCLSKALKKRQVLVSALGGPAVLPGPQPDWIDHLSELGFIQLGGRKYDFRVPSFQLIQHVLRVALEKSGSRSFSSTGNKYY